MKKVLSLVMSSALVLALAVPAIASTPTTTTIDDASKLATGATTAIAGTTEVGTINISVPASGSVIINPYGLDADGNGATDQIVSATQYVESGSTSKIKVSAAVSGVVKGNAKLATESTSGASLTTNSVFLKFVAAPVADNSTELPSTGATEIIVGTRGVVTEVGTLDGTSTALAFQLQGDAVTEPKTPWTAADTVDVNVAFTFALADNAAAATP